jgi:polygalacturonase
MTMTTVSDSALFSRCKHTLFAAAWLGFAGLAAAVPDLPIIPAGTFVITDYGAVGNGISTNTTAIQTALDAAGAAGGGTVIVPSGTFLSGSLLLTNGINLQISSGATLKMLPYGSYPGTNTFISGTNLHDVEISGAGIIEGQGAGWWSGPGTGPALVHLTGCLRVRAREIRLQNAPGEHLALGGAGSHLTIQSLTVNTSGAPGDTASIHLSGINCLVEGCSINNSGDDNIQILADTAATSDVIITNCFLGNGHGLSLGSSTVGGISNVLVTDCTFSGTRNGIRLKASRGRGGVVQNIACYNLNMTNVRIPITIYSYYNTFSSPNNITPVTALSDPAQPVTNTTPIWRNITISNLTATTQSGFVAGTIWGLPEMPVSGITLSKININASKTFNIFNAQDVILDNARITLPGGVSTVTLFNASTILSNCPGTINFDGLVTPQTNNVIALFNSTAQSNTNALGNAPTLAFAGSQLAINNSLVLSSNALLTFHLGSNPSVVAVNGGLVLGGTLNITNAAGFGEGTYTLFTHIGPLSLDDLVIGSAPMGYTVTISTNTPGQVNLSVTRAEPAFQLVSIDESGLSARGGGGVPNSICYVVATTNLALPLADWTRVATNQFDNGGNFFVNDAVDGNVSQKFYRLQLP